MNMILKLQPYKLFTVADEKYIFTSKGNKLYKIDEKMFEALMGCNKEYEITISEDSCYFDDILENLCASSNDVDREQVNFEIQSIVLMIIQDCNLNCKYCYGDGGEFREKGIMSIDIAKRAVDYLISHSGNRKNLGVVFFGGEPLLNFNLIKEVLNYLEKVERENKINFSKSITTNATLLNDEIKDYLLANNVNIKISIDGPKSIHDNMRVFPDGRGSFDKVMENTRELRKLGKAVARATVTSNCLETKEIEAFLYDKGFTDVGMAYAEESLTENDYEKIYKIECSYFDEIEKLIHQKKYEEITSNFSKTKAYLLHIHSSIMGHYPCGAGRTFYAVDKNGCLYPCQRFVGISQFQLGNINEGAFKQKEFIDKINVKAHIKCNECWCRNICLGKCSYDNYSKTQKIEEPFEPGCQLTKKLYERAVKLYILLSDDEKKQLFYYKSNK